MKTPTNLIFSLERVRSRVRILGALYGVGVVVAGAVTTLLLLIAGDYLLHLPAGARLLFALALTCATLYTLWRLVAVPVLSRMPLRDIAGKLEGAFPQFDDRLRSTMDFIGSDVPGSEVMKQRVVAQASEIAGAIDLGSAVIARPAWYSIALASGMLAIAFTLSLALPNLASIGINRLVHPFLPIPWPRQVVIAPAGDMPTRVPVGQRIEVKVRLTRGDSPSRKANLFYQYDDGPVQRELLQRDANGIWTSTLDARVESGRTSGKLKAWVEAGDDRFDFDPISVVPKLAILSVIARLSPPAYVRTGATESTVNLATAPAVVADGSSVKLDIEFNKQLGEGDVVSLVPTDDKSGASTRDIAWKRSSSSAVSAGFTARQSVKFHVRGTDLDGFANGGLEEYEIVVRPDQSPSVQIDNPRRNEERTAAAVVPLVASTEDDYGIESLKLIVDRIGGEKKQWVTELISSGAAVSDDRIKVARIEGSADRIRQRVEFSWDLAQLDGAKLKPGDVLEYYLVAKDNFDLDGQSHPPVASAKLRIAIISQEDLAARVIDELRQIKSQINGVKGSQQRTLGETNGFVGDTKDKPALDNADHAVLERLTAQQATGASQSKQLAAKVRALKDRLAENKSPSKDLFDTTSGVAEDLDRAAEQPMRDATARLTDADRPNTSPATRNESIAQAAAKQQEAADTLQHAIDRMANIGSLQQTIDGVRQLLEAQQQIGRETREIGKSNLGKTPEQMAADDRDRLSKNADEQSKLAERTNKALAEMQKLAEQLAKSDPSAADAMKRAASTAKQQQVAPNQQKAAQQARQNQQSQAQASQKQVELGLELVLNDLREAERHKLAELQKKLEELQQQIANLVRRQAGHNYDNLAIRGPDALGKAGKPLAEELLTKAERDKTHSPAAPTVPQFSTAQEQTQRNTADIARGMADVPDSAESAAQLTRAASRMERALVGIRDNRLDEAYDPNQVEALAALEQARKIIDKQKQDVDDQVQQREQEAIRQKYIKLRDDQQRLNDDTSRIDAAQGPDGSLGRADAVRLGQLPGEQGKLADRADAITEDLGAVGSTVYVWANKDIVSSMNDVKSDLAKPTTAEPTRAEQARIVEQLDAMIRNLSTKPRESKFAQDNPGGGGGGGNGGPKLPAEAELRLLKELQLAINRSTESISKLPNKDKPKLATLGGRQGELRNLLDQTLQKASQGQMKLGPEPDNKDQLPEEAGAEAIDNQELDQDLLNGVPDEAKNGTKANLVGDRMARSRQRLALNDDPGKVTQTIQKRIVDDMDYLIEQARQQQAQTRNSPNNKNNKSGQQMPKPQPGEAQAQNQGKNQGKSQPNAGTVAAGQSKAPGAADTTADLSKNIRESAAEWGTVTPRLRDAVLDSADENVVEQYRKLVEDYYRSVANSGAGANQQ